MRTETSHFYVGYFPDEDDYFEFVGESENYYDEDEDAAENDAEEKYISAFARSQGETWLDHDFMESVFNEEPVPLTEKFGDASYAEEWADELQRRIDASGNTSEINTLVFISKDQIHQPVSVKTDTFHLLYMGEIEYKI